MQDRLAYSIQTYRASNALAPTERNFQKQSEAANGTANNRPEKADVLNKMHAG